MKIINDTVLSYETIGAIIDYIMDENKGETHYYGKTEKTTMDLLDREIRIQIRYLKRYTEWRFTEK